MPDNDTMPPLQRLLEAHACFSYWVEGDTHNTAATMWLDGVKYGVMVGPPVGPGTVAHLCRSAVLTIWRAPVVVPGSELAALRFLLIAGGYADPFALDDLRRAHRRPVAVVEPAPLVVYVAGTSVRYEGDTLFGVFAVELDAARYAVAESTGGFPWARRSTVGDPESDVEVCAYGVISTHREADPDCRAVGCCAWKLEDDADDAEVCP